MPAVHSTLTLSFKEMQHVPKRNSKNIGSVKTVIPTRQPVEIEFLTKFNFSNNTVDIKSKNFKMLSEKQQKIVVNKVIDYVSDLWNDLPEKFYDADYSEITVKVDCPDVKYEPSGKTVSTKKTKTKKNETSQESEVSTDPETGKAKRTPKGKGKAKAKPKAKPTPKPKQTTKKKVAKKVSAKRKPVKKGKK